MDVPAEDASRKRWTLGLPRPRPTPGADAAFDPAVDQAPPPRRVGLRGPLRDLVVHAFYNWRIIVASAALPILLGIGLALYSGTQFTATTLLIVLLGRENTSSSDITGTNPVNLSITGLKEIASEIDIIYSNDVIEQTIRAVGPAVLLPSVGRRRWLGLLPPMEGPRQIETVGEWFRERLRAAVQNDTNILRVAFTAPERELAVRALAALTQSYFDHRRTVYASTTSRYLSAELDGYTTRLSGLQSQIEAVKTQYGLVDVQQDMTAASNRLDRIQRRQDELRERQQAVHARAAAAAAKLAREQKTVFASRDVSNQNANDDSRNALLRLQVERDHLATGYAPTYPPLAELDRKIASTRAAIGAAQRTNSTATRDVRNPTWDTLNNDLISAQVEEASLNQQLAEVDAQLGPAREQAAALRSAEIKLRDLQRDHDVLDASYRQFAAREASARIDEDAARTRNANVHVVQQPTAPLRGSSLRLSFLTAGLLGSVLLAAAAAVMSTMLRNVYILPGEAERHLHLRVLADLPFGATQFGSAAGAASVANLATMLLDIAGEGERRGLFQFVPAETGGAAPRMVRALATEFAVIHNLRTLLIDIEADGTAHLAALGASGGRPARVADTGLSVQATRIPTLFVATDAPGSDLASSRTLLPQLRRLFAELRASFEMVLIVAPSDVGDYAARRLATLVDTNIVVLEADRTRATAAQELCESLASVAAPILGAVMVGARTFVPRSALRWL